ncbi:MAG: metallophosphoesterase family protein [Candidatus Nanoarchaeia archaeon]
MKLFAFGDTHGDFFVLEYNKELAKKADLVACIGDVSVFSEHLEEIIPHLATMHEDILLIHGNHEDADDVNALSAPHKSIHFCHKKISKREGYTFVCYGGDGFSQIDEEFETFIESIKDELTPKKTIFILHGPPHNTKIDVPFEDHHSGSLSYRKIIEDVQPLLVLSGHIHEGEHLIDSIGKTLILNPGPDGELIDLEVLSKEREEKEKKT